MIKVFRAALSKLNRAALKTTQSSPRSAAALALNYTSVATLDPCVLARAFAAADQGEITEQASLFELVEEQDAHIFGELAKRRRSVTGLGWHIVPPEDASESELARTDELADMLRNIPRFEDAQYDITDAIGKGFVALEIDWQAGETWLPRSIDWVPQRMFRVINQGANAGELQYLKDGIPEPLREWGWVIHEHRAKSGYIEQSALFRVLAWTYAYKQYNVRDMQRFLEVYGLPLRLGKYPAGLGKEDRDALLRAVRNIGHDGAGVIPETMAIEFIEAQKSGTVTDFLSAVEYWERKQSIAILGGTLTSQADGKTSTNALGEVHDHIRREIMLHDIRQIEPSITRQLLRPICLVNGIFPENRLPTFAYLTEETVDQEKMVKVLAQAVEIGMEIDIGWAHRAMQIPRAAEGDEILKKATAGNQAWGEPYADLKRQAALSRQNRPTDMAEISADRLVDDTSADIGAWFGKIEAMLEAAGSLEEFREMLLAAFPELDDSAVVEKLTNAFAALDLHGRADIEAPK
ncbi:MAG: DUF935 domain-containing protein [Betaproteobacteria bacterium]|nr:DUF935 domain-containing protein [Betaproteobacteria bacterium]